MQSLKLTLTDIYIHKNIKSTCVAALIKFNIDLFSIFDPNIFHFVINDFTNSQMCEIVIIKVSFH